MSNVTARNIAIVSLLFMTVMLFMDNPIQGVSRLYEALWNTGHLFFFALLSWLMLMSRGMYHRPVLAMLMFSLLMSFTLGGLIEAIQFASGRFMELQDLLLDILGGLLGYMLVLARLPAERVPRLLAERRSMLVFPMVIVVLLAFLPVILVLQDELRMQRSFPVLAGFESVHELNRWDYEGISHFGLNRNQVRHGRSVSIGDINLISRQLARI